MVAAFPSVFVATMAVQLTMKSTEDMLQRRHAELPQREACQPHGLEQTGGLWCFADGLPGPDGCNGGMPRCRNGGDHECTVDDDLELICPCAQWNRMTQVRMAFPCFEKYPHPPAQRLAGRADRCARHPYPESGCLGAGGCERTRSFRQCRAANQWSSFRCHP